jgi:hypothetical protein
MEVVGIEVEKEREKNLFSSRRLSFISGLLFPSLFIVRKRDPF